MCFRIRKTNTEIAVALLAIEIKHTKSIRNDTVLWSPVVHKLTKKHKKQF